MNSPNIPPEVFAEFQNDFFKTSTPISKKIKNKSLSENQLFNHCSFLSEFIDGDFSENLSPNHQEHVEIKKIHLDIECREDKKVNINSFENLSPSHTVSAEQISNPINHLVNNSYDL